MRLSSPPEPQYTGEKQKKCECGVHGDHPVSIFLFACARAATGVCVCVCVCVCMMCVRNHGGKSSELVSDASGEGGRRRDVCEGGGAEVAFGR